MQSSSEGSGRGSPITAPEDDTLPLALPAVRIAPAVLPEIKLITPGAEGPNVVLNELSLMAKFCA